MRALGLLVLLPLVACSGLKAESGDAVEPRGKGPQRVFDVSGFTAVELRGADDVDVRVGPAFSVRAQGPSEELNRLEIVREGDTLRVGRKRDMKFWGKSEGVKVFVTLPRLTAAAVAGSGDLAVDRVEGERFDGDLAGSGNLSVGEMRVDEARLSIAGSGDVTGAGAAKRLRMDIAGSGDIDARQLTANEARISIAGSGNAKATVNGPAKIDMMGAGNVELGGSPQCSTNKMGSGEVRCG